MRKLTTLLALLGAFLLALPALAADAPAPAKLYFDTGKTDLPADAAKAVAPLADYAKATKDAKLAISGFHDKTGDPAANHDLAKKRAMAVKDVLVAAGVAEGALELAKPVETTGAADDREARRVEVSIVGLLVAAPAAASAAGAPRRGRGRADAEQGRQRVDDRRDAAGDHDVDPGPGAVLRRHRALEEHAVGADAGVRRVLADHRALGVYGYSIAFTEGNAFFGSLDRLFLRRHLLDAGRRGRVRHGGDVLQGHADPGAHRSSRSRPPSRRSPCA